MSTLTAPAPAARRADPAWTVPPVLVGYLVLAVLLYSGLWAHLSTGYLTDSGQDQHLFEWFLAATAHAVASGADPLFSGLQNAPYGVNMMANTSLLGLGVPLTPLTLACGPTVTLAVVLTGGVAATAGCWFWVLRRDLGLGVGAAGVGGGFAGFAPPVVAHGTAHPNFCVLFVIPLIVHAVCALHRGNGPMVRIGVLLGLLVTWQVFVGEEALLLTATALLVLGLRTGLRRCMRGVGVAAAVAAPLLAYPLWFQFAGPGSYRRLWHGDGGNDLLAFGAFGTRSLAGGAPLAVGATEQNAAFGWPLLVVVAVLLVWLRRRVLVQGLALVLAVTGVLSLGASLTVGGHDLRVTLPWVLLDRFPPFDTLLVTRLSLVWVPVIGVLLALGFERVRWPGRAALGAVLLTVLPTPYPVSQRPPVAAATAVPDGALVLADPVPTAGDARALDGQVAAGMRFRLAGGYFVGPGTDGDGTYGPVDPAGLRARLTARFGRPVRIGDMWCWTPR